MSASVPVQIAVRQRSRQQYEGPNTITENAIHPTTHPHLIDCLTQLATRPTVFFPATLTDDAFYWSICHPRVRSFVQDLKPSSIIITGRLATGKTSFMCEMVSLVLQYLSRNIVTKHQNQIEFSMSAIELLGDCVFDLMDVEVDQSGKGVYRSKHRKNLRLVEDSKDNLSINAEDATEIQIRPNLNTLRLVSLLKKNRTTRSFARNPSSSAGHMIVTIKAQCSQSGERARLHLVDMAPAVPLVRQSMDSVSIGEMNIINQSHETLLQVCRLLNSRERMKRVPYRSSRLTRILNSTMTIDCHSLLIGMVQNAHFSDPETRHSLNYLRQIAADTDEQYQSLDEWFRNIQSAIHSLPISEIPATESECLNQSSKRSAHQINTSSAPNVQASEIESKEILYDEAKSLHLRIRKDTSFVDLVNIFSDVLVKTMQHQEWS
eukprot:TRINITY_DN20057_c0_g1_i1.p1 TRINITY_DN20057_c0_g1~~TRINITY_DN20057_c0_g1_i1.p1  ORF type:complete len:434 (-),score=85.58 TRINITY_DN20057_c0_g1_i1:61-1362(-)